MWRLTSNKHNATFYRSNRNTPHIPLLCNLPTITEKPQSPGCFSETGDPWWGKEFEAMKIFKSIFVE